MQQALIKQLLNILSMETNEPKVVDEKVEVPTPAFESGKIYVFGYNRHEIRKNVQRGQKVSSLLFSNFIRQIITDAFDILNVYSVGDEVTVVAKKQ